MCEAETSAVQLQCGKIYGFSNKKDVRTTVLSALDSKGLLTNCQQFFNILVKVAKSQNHKFKAKDISNNITPIKSNQGKIHSLSRRLSQILSTHNLWEGIQKEKLKQSIIAKIEKGNKTKDVTKKLLEDCKSQGGPFTMVNKLVHVLHRRTELQDIIIKTDMTYHVKEHK